MRAAASSARGPMAAPKAVACPGAYLPWLSVAAGPSVTGVRCGASSGSTTAEEASRACALGTSSITGVKCGASSGSVTVTGAGTDACVPPDDAVPSSANTRLSPQACADQQALLGHAVSTNINIAPAQASRFIATASAHGAARSSDNEGREDASSPTCASLQGASWYSVHSVVQSKPRQLIRAPPP